MTLGDDLAWALPELRAQAESMMRDTCTIVSPPTDKTWDEGTGTYALGLGVVIYSGKCRVRDANPSPQDVVTGESLAAKRRVTLSLPVDGSSDVEDGCVVTITASLHDPGSVGTVMRVLSGHHQTDSTARRIPCQVVSADG